MLSDKMILVTGYFYRLMLFAYPVEFRTGYETEMMQAFHDRSRHVYAHGDFFKIAQFYLDMAEDFITSLFQQHLDIHRRQVMISNEPQQSLIIALITGLILAAGFLAESAELPVLAQLVLIALFWNHGLKWLVLGGYFRSRRYDEPGNLGYELLQTAPHILANH